MPRRHVYQRGAIVRRPANDKETARLIVSRIILDTREDLNMAYPISSDERRHELLADRTELAE